MRKRAFILGCIFSALTGMLDPYLVFKGLPGRFGWEYWAPAAIFLLFIMLILSSIHRFFELKKSELFLIFIMVSVASVLPSYGLMHYLMATVVGLKYFATSANRWQELIISRIRPVMLLQDENAVRWFFEGLPPGASAPYGEWLMPMSYLMVYVMVFSFLSICVMVLFRKQWIERERLIYPLMILPLEMARKDGQSRVPVLFRDKLFWLGLSITFFFYLMNWISLTSTGEVMIGMRKGLIISERFGLTFVLNPDFPILGFSYLIPRSVSLSMWLFLIISTVQNSIFSVAGFRLPGMNAPFGGRTAASTFQGGGAMIVLVFFLCWRARRHLADCFRKAFTPAASIDDSDEILPYRTAVIGTILGFFVMCAFLRHAGMPWFASFFFMLFVMVVFIGLSRIVCQTGLPSAQSQCIPPAYASYLLPPGVITENGYIALGLQYSWTASLRSSVMTTGGHMLRIQDDARIPPRTVFAAIMAALVISYVSSAWVHIHLAYNIGALNTTGTWFGDRIFGGSMSNEIANAILPHLQDPLTGDVVLSRWIWTGIGAAVMSVLVFLHSKFLWWPIHYIGFPISDSSVIRRWWFAIFLAWLIKGLVLRFGGHNVYRRSVSFFLGVILSHITWTVAEILLNMIFDKRGYVSWF